MSEKAKIMIGIPYNQGMQAKAVLSVTNLATFLNRLGHAIDINYQEGTLLSSQRNALARTAYNEGYNLLCIDSDMEFQPSDALQILEVDAPVVAGLCYARRHPHKPLVFSEDLTDSDSAFKSYPFGEIPDKPFKCAGIGTGIMHIKHKTLQRLWENENAVGRPFNFWTTKDQDQLGEDLSFCHRCNLLGIDIYCIPTVNIGHLGLSSINRSDHIMAIQRDHHYCNDVPGNLTLGEMNWLYNKAKEINDAYLIVTKDEGIHPLKQYDGYDKVKRTLADSKIDFIPIWNIKTKNIIKKDMVFVHSDNIDFEKIFNKFKPNKIICGNGYTSNFKVHQAVNEVFGVENIKTFESIWYIENPEALNESS
jgi:hypothetical protein